MIKTKSFGSNYLLDLRVGKNFLSPKPLTIKKRLIYSSISKLRVYFSEDTIMEVRR